MDIVKQILRVAKTIIRKCSLVIILGLSLQFVDAQSTETDTVLLLSPDSTEYTVPEREVVSPVDNYYRNDDDDEKEEEYFLQKWMQGRMYDTLQLRQVPDSAAQALRNDKNFWYANKIFEKEKKEKPPKRKSFDFPFLNVLLWVLVIGGFAAFLILFLANSNVRIFRRSSTVKVSDEEVETEDIFAINYQKEIDKAVQSGNYRLATRLMFLRLLRNLSDRNIIQYKQDRTNFDYLAQLHKTAWYDGFFRITRNYEYTWYGLFDVDREQFSGIRTDFENFEKMLNKR